MRKIVKKRLIYFCPWTHDVWYGAEEYDENMTDENILGAVYEVGKTSWCPTGVFGNKELWLLKPYPADPKVKLPLYKIQVEEFYIYHKSWFDRIRSFLSFRR